MATIWIWLSFGLSVLSAIGVGYLLIDTRCERRATRDWRRAILAQVGGHDVAIGDLTRAVRAMDPTGIKPTAQWKRPTDDALALARSAVAPQSPPPARGATAARIEAASRVQPDVDTTGDRGGVNPGDSIPQDAAPGSAPTSAEIRARFEGEAEARSQARAEGAPAPPNTAGDDEAEDDRTRVYNARDVRRQTLLGGLAGVPLERPRSDARRSAEAFRKEHPSSPTLVSEGVTPPPSASRPLALEVVANLDAATLARVDALAAQLGVTRDEILVRCAEAGTTDLEALARTLRALGTPANDRGTPSPLPPRGPVWDPRITRRWHEKVEAARAKGQNVRHCVSTLACCGTERSTAGCECTCDGCGRLTALMADAAREVLGGRG